ncbi:hypothetical protein [Haloglomus salinum]|uniref:hypothetical protein n=1 Tax=Haloglomus salinum TaxID=2962673 RepID=UPI0020C9FF99|nr:hypothetical protein [Haloglomus salinum]
MVGLAGCSRSQADPASPTDIGGGEPGSVFQSLSFDLGDLVIGLPEDHGVSQISLVEPDGTVFKTVRPDFAATTVRIAVADPEIGDSDYVHYTPGVHELVAKAGNQTERRSIDLHPEVAITGIRLNEGGDRLLDSGKVVVRIENTGTAPTWAHDIAFEGAPDWTADTPLSDFPGIPFMGGVSADSAVISPGGRQEYVSNAAPAVFDKEASVECAGEKFEFKINVGIATGEILSTSVRLTAEGNPGPETTGGRFVCDSSRIEVLDG